MAYTHHLPIDERAVIFAEYMLDTKSTVRGTAAHYGFSKSTVHKDLTSRLKTANRTLYEQVVGLLNENMQSRHIRGGNATKLKYSELKNVVKGKNGR